MSFGVTRLLLFVILTTALDGSRVFASDVDNELNSSEAVYEYDVAERLLIIPTFTVNISSLQSSGLLTTLPTLLALGTSALALIGTFAVGALLIAVIVSDGPDVFNDGSFRSEYSTFSSSKWEELSIAGVINLLAQTWDNFDPTNPDCQKKLICEVNHNTELFGSTAEKFIAIFELLNVVEAISFPSFVKNAVAEYLVAAYAGDCTGIYSGCKFSISKVALDYKNHNHS